MRLPDVVCDCGRIVISREFVANARGGAPKASGYDSCLRVCDACGIGYSNAFTADRSKLQRILRSPLSGLPSWLNDDLDYALDNCLNQGDGHSVKKRNDFHSLASEDHATWVVFRALERAGGLGAAFNRRCASPAMLLWGVPIPKSSATGDALQNRLLNVLRNHIGEKEDWFSEPDVVIDFEDSIVVVEAKLTSKNDKKSPNYRGWNRYVDSSAFASRELAIKSGLYQLARNWRIALELAGGRPFTVVNLAPSFSITDRTDLAMLRLSTVKRRGILTLRTWSQIASALKDERWLRLYGQQRGLWAAS